MYRAAILVFFLSLSSLIILPASAQDSFHTQQAEAEAKQWFQLLQQGHKKKHYDVSFVVMQPNGVQTYRWAHTYTERGQEIEVIESLNGPQNQALRVHDVVLYQSANQDSYVIQSQHISSPIPIGLFSDYESLSQNYRLIAVGGGRVANREAQHIRILPITPDRYAYSLWIDRKTGLLLAMDTYSFSGDIIEQVLLTSFHVQTEPLAELIAFEREFEQEFDRTQLADKEQEHAKRQALKAWFVHQIPQGYQLESSQEIVLSSNGLLAERYLFNDGMSQFSVYIIKDKQHILPVEYEGSISMVSMVHTQFAITVVGHIPLTMARKIAEQIGASS